MCEYGWSYSAWYALQRNLESDTEGPGATGHSEQRDALLFSMLEGEPAVVRTVGLRELNWEQETVIYVSFHVFLFPSLSFYQFGYCHTNTYIEF